MGEYRYDLGVARDRALALKAALPGVSVFYAVKANGHPAVVEALAQICDGLDVASAGELELAVAGQARRIVCSGPAKSAEFLRAASRAGATVNVESLAELHRIGDLPLRITLRVARSVDLPGSHDMSRAQFGIDLSELDQAVALVRQQPNLDLVGWHLHAASNVLDVAAYNDFIASSLRWAVETAASLGVDLREVNLGGGFGVSYDSDRVFDPALLRIDPPPGVDVLVEPGRWLVAEAGWYAAEVVDLKHNHGRWFAVIRGGMHQFRTPTAYRISFPFTISPRDDWPHPWPRPVVEDVMVDVVGELCTPNDVMSRDQYVQRLRVGDVLVFAKAGAYGWDISPHQYLRHPSPSIVILL